MDLCLAKFRPTAGRTAPLAIITPQDNAGAIESGETVVSAERRRDCRFRVSERGPLLLNRGRGPAFRLQLARPLHLSHRLLVLLHLSHVCVCVCVRACVRACMCARVFVGRTPRTTRQTKKDIRTRETIRHPGPQDTQDHASDKERYTDTRNYPTPRTARHPGPRVATPGPRATPSQGGTAGEAEPDRPQTSSVRLFYSDNVDSDEAQPDRPQTSSVRQIPRRGGIAPHGPMRPSLTDQARPFTGVQTKQPVTKRRPAASGL